MGKSRKKLAVLLTAAMTLSMTFGMTAFAADDTIPDESAPVVEAADTESDTQDLTTEPAPVTPADTEGEDLVPAADTDEPGTPYNTDIAYNTDSPDDVNDPTGSETPDEADVPDNNAEAPDSNTGTVTIPEEEPADNGGQIYSEPAVPEEEPTEVQIAGSENLTKSESFVSLGEGKGSYQYNGETLVLKDAQIEIEGWSGIAITGDLVIILEGNNAIIVGANAEGIAIYDGDLTIKGDGTLSISNKLGGYQADGSNDYYEGIYSLDGDITIDGATVNVDVYSDSKWPNSAIYAGGDINIINGANVTAKSTAMGDKDLTHYGIYSNGGRINIIDSNVTASADGKFSFEDGILQSGIGLFSQDSQSLYDLDADCLSGILIDNSNVRSIGSFASMLVIGRNGTITIDGSTIVSPEGVNVRDLIAVIEDDPDAAASVIGAILASGEGPIDMDAIMDKINDLIAADDEEALIAYLNSLFGSIAKDVNIIRNSELYAEKAGIPVTGDSLHAELLILSLIAAGAVSAYLIRKRMTA